MKNHILDLRDKARQVMLAEGFHADFPDDANREAEALDEEKIITANLPFLRDLRSLLWSSIDNPDSRDLDQVEVAERQPDGSIRILVGIADVDAFVPRESAIDRNASQNATSVYTGVEPFPMLPDRLSTSLTSLLEDEDRLAIVIDLLVAEDGKVQTSGIYRSILRNRAKLDYESAGHWLEGNGPAPEKIAEMPELANQLLLQYEAAVRLGRLRRRNGALDFETIEARPVAQNGEVFNLTVRRKTRANYLIENFMIAANTSMASFLEAQGALSLQRIVRKPERWPRIVEIADSYGETLPAEPDSRALADFLASRKSQDPDHFPDLSLSIVKLMGAGEYVVVSADGDPGGHFGLAVPDYTNSTAPNRRYPDLLTQRLVKAVLSSAPSPYTQAELEMLATHCEERQSAARKVERFMRKVIAADLLNKHLGETFEAIVTGVSTKGTFARLITPPAEGKVVRGEKGLDVGDKIKVRLLATEPEKGFIDFEKT